MIRVIGCVNLNVMFRTSGGNVSLSARNVAHVPELHYNLFLPRRVGDADHDYVGNEGINMF